MTKFFHLILLGWVCTALPHALIAQQEPTDAEIIRELYKTALREAQGYSWLKELTDIGGRFAGTPEADAAVIHFQAIADSLGFNTRLQPVKVPRWVRGPVERAYYQTNGKLTDLPVTALGSSVATPEGGLKAPLVELRSFAQLDSLGDALEGKIAFFNIPMDPTYINSFFAYGQAVKQRRVGAVEASKKGAAGVVIRSLSNTINEYPHTGSMTYRGADRKIPALAISTAAAEKLSRDLKKDPDIEFFMELQCHWEDSVMSSNLIAEWPGTEKPGEVIVVGGHIDSWDLGTGAHDDGAGCMHALEAAWLLQKLNLPLKRSLRVVFFMNEEFGLSGARAYAREAKKEKDIRHVIALESDAGGFTPRGIGITASDSLVEVIKQMRSLLEPYGIHRFSPGGSGADISQLRSDDMILIGLRPDTHRYFEVHHSALDVLDQVNPRELEMGSATLAAIIYWLDKHDITAVPGSPD